MRTGLRVPVFFTLVLLLCGAARATEEPLLNGYLRDHKDGVSLTCWYENEHDSDKVESALCAVYDGNGMLMTVAGLEPKSGTQTVVVPCETALVDHVKLMTLNAAHQPLSTSRMIKPSATNTDAPQFLSGYPVVSENSYSVTGSAMTRVKVMADRACRLYWSLYKHGHDYYATAARFTSNNLPGSEKHSMMILAANQPDLITLTGLEDQTDYDLDLWLTNSDFSASSYIIRLSFRTVDTTPPEFLVAPTDETVTERAATLKYSLNENATLYWTAVESGTRFPNPPTGGGAITTEYAIKQVTSGNGALTFGKVTARANATGTFTVYGLSPQKSYNIWYVAQDTSGNYTEFRLGSPDSENASVNPRGVCMLTVFTLDKQPPAVTQETTLYPSGHPDTPYADTSVRLIFSEGIRRFSTGEVLSDLYSAVTSAADESARATAKETLAAFLRSTVTLYSGSVPAPERATGTESAWMVDYRNATVSWEENNLVLTFATTEDTDADSALRLMGGRPYCFQLQDLSDLSENLNRITSLKTDVFTTLPAQIDLQEFTLNSTNYPSGVSEIDLAFTAKPIAVSRASSETSWDFFFWTDKTCAYEVYSRSRLSTSSFYDRPWTKMQSNVGTGGTGYSIIPDSAVGQMSGQSMHLHLCQYTSGSVPALNSLQDGRIYEYAVRFVEVEGDSDRSLWDSEVQFGVTAVAASASTLMNLAANITQERVAAAKSTGSIQEISSPNPFMMTRTFLATAAPTFTNGAPTFTPGDTNVTMWFQMTRPGTVYYLLAPAGGTITTRDTLNRDVNWGRYMEIPESGGDSALTPFNLSAPNWLNIVNQRFSGGGVRTGFLQVDGSGASCTVNGLKSEQHYFAYFVLQGTGSIYSTSAQLFRFTTLEAAPPSVRMTLSNPVAGLSVNQEAIVDYLVIDTDTNVMDPLLSVPFWNNTPSGGRGAMSSYVQVDSVLEAMCMDTGNGSVFDVYGTKDYKDKVAAFIRQSLSDGTSVIGLDKGRNVNSSSALSIDCSLLPMKEFHKYAVVSVTQSVDGGANVFRAVRPITPPDSIPPLVTEITQNLTMDGSDSIELNTCSGTVKLTFDSDLYYLNGGEMKTIDLGPHYSTIRDGNHIPVVDIASPTPAGAIEVSSGQMIYVNRSTSVINLTLKNAASGSTITFPTEMCDEYGNVHTVSLTVKLNISTTLTGYDSAGRAVYIHKPTITVSTPWDGRTSS